MINFIDEYGKQHVAIVECQKTKGVNGEKSLSGTIYTNDEILEGIGRGWRLQFEDENYCLTYVNPLDEGNRIVVEFDAVHEFFFDLRKSVIYSEMNGSNTANAYLQFIFNGSGYEYRLEVTIPAFEKESFGMKNRLDLFKDFISSTGVEFSVNGKIVRILEKVGTNLSTVVKKGFNLNELRIEKDPGSFITYLRGYGAFVDPDDESKGRLIVEYLSPLAEVFGKLEGDPVIDERYTVANNLIERLKSDVENSYGISVDIDMEDLTRAGYDYDQPHEGDYIMAINKDLGFEQKIRIMSYTTSYDTEGNIIDHDVSCGSDNIIQKKINQENEYRKEVQAGLENAISTANQAWISADGKNKVFQGPDRPTATNKGDIWYQVDGEQTIMNYWDGFDWVPFINPDAVKESVEQAKQAGENAQEAADQAKADAQSAQAKADKIQIDVNGLVSDVTTINGTVNSISSKANEAYNKANAVEGRTATLETSVTGLTGRITDVESTATSTTKKLNELVVTVDGQKQTIATVTTTAESALNKANVLETTVDGVTRTLTSVESTISNIGALGTNLLINGGFENDLFGWTGDSVHKIDTVERHSGSKALRVDASGSIKVLNLNVKIPVYQGQQLEFSMWYKTTSDFNGTSNNNKLRIGKQDGSLLAGYGWDGAVTEWTNRVVTLTVGSGISELTIEIDSGHSAGKVWWDNISITDVTNRNQTNIKVNQISETVDGHTQLIASTKTTANSALTKATQVETTANGLKTTISSVETTANNALTKATQVEQTADGLVSTVNRIDGGGTNLVSNGGFENDYVGWTQPTGFTITTNDSHSGSKSLAVSNTGSAGRAIERRLNVPVVPGRKYEVSYWYKTTADANGVYSNQKLRIGQANGTLITALGWDGASTEWSQKSQIYTAGPNIFEWSIMLTANHTVGTVWWDDISIVDVTDREATASQITQLSDTINLKVSKNDVINQINISTDGILIAGNKVQITGQTYIEDGVIGRAQIANLAVSTAQIADAAITDAKIGSLSATKITTGTLNASNVNIINLNANSITTGTISGTNLSINLATGEVIFNKGIIKNLDDTFQMNITTGVTSSRGEVPAIGGTGTNVTGFDLMNGRLDFISGAFGNATANYGGLRTLPQAGQSVYPSGSRGRGWFAGSAPAITLQMGDPVDAVWQTHKRVVLLASTDYIEPETTEFAGTPRSGYGTFSEGGGYENMRGAGMGVNQRYAPDTSSAFVDEIGGNVSQAWMFGRHGVFLASGYSYDTTMSGSQRYMYPMLRLGMGIVTKLNNSESIKQLASTAQLTAGYKIDMRSRLIQFWLGDEGKFEVIGKRTDINSGGGDSSFYGGMSFGQDSGGGKVWSKAIYDRTTGSASNVFVSSGGILARSTSARKYKTDITKANDVLEKASLLYNIQPVSWFDKAELKINGSSDRYYGFIADEFDELGLKEVVQYGENGEVESLAYDRLSIYMIPLIQSLKKEVDQLKNKLKELEAA